MKSLKNKLEKNIMVFNTQGSQCYLKKEEAIDILGFYERFINWVSGEFDLFLQHQSGDLTVYFPNGSFRISSFISKEAKRMIKVEVKGKSRKACEKIMQRLERIYNHVASFQGNKEMVFNKKIETNDIN